jgi:hypothetical protein
MEVSDLITGFIVMNLPKTRRDRGLVIFRFLLMTVPELGLR